MKLTDEQKKNRKEFAEISKRLDKEAGRDKVKYHSEGDSDFNYRSFVLFDGTEVTQGGWLIGRKWMTAKLMKDAESRWVAHSYKTRADNIMKIKGLPPDVLERLVEIDREYDLSAGCGQCGGCRWFAALDADYGMCCNKEGLNDGRITFEHGGCIQHSFIQELLQKSGEPSPLPARGKEMILQLTAQVVHKCKDCRLIIRVGESMIRSEHKKWDDGSKTFLHHHLKCWQEKQGRRG